MRNLVRGMVLSAFAALALVPIQASPAAAFVGALDVEPEVALRITGSIQRFTATVTGVTPLDGHQIAYSTDAIPLNDTNACVTDTTGVCTFTRTSTSEAAAQELRVYVKDAEPPAVPCMTPATGNNCDANEPRDESTESPADDPDDTDVVSIEFKNGTLNVEPEEAPTAPSQAVTLTATVLSTETPTPRPLLANVDAEVTLGPNNTPGPNPTSVDNECNTVAATGSCSLTYTPGAASGVDELDSWIDLNDDPLATPSPTGDETQGTGYEGDSTEGPNEGTTPGNTEPDNTDVVVVNISANPILDVSPESQTKATNTAATFTASVTQAQAPQSGIRIAAAIDTGGANAGKVIPFCTTGANGQCSLTYTGTAAGVDKVRAAIDADSNSLPNEGDSTEDVSTPGGTPEPDTTDVVQVTWTGTTPTPPPAVDTDCEQAKQKVKKLKKKLKKARKADNEAKIKKLKKKLKRARAQKRAACA